MELGREGGTVVLTCLTMVVLKWEGLLVLGQEYGVGFWLFWFGLGFGWDKY